MNTPLVMLLPPGASQAVVPHFRERYRSRRGRDRPAPAYVAGDWGGGEVVAAEIPDDPADNDDALEQLVRANEGYLSAAYAAGIHPPPLFRSGVYYRREPLGSEVWQSIPALYATGSGDCEDLAAALAAEMRADGYSKTKAIAKKVRSFGGRSSYHVVVEHCCGEIVDPSRMLGMV